MKKFILYSLFFCPLTTSLLNASEILGTVTGNLRKLADSVVYIEKIEGQIFSPSKIPVALSQEGMKFTPHVLPIIVGSTVEFLNQDDVLHNVFSPGKLERFNLGTYSRGTKKVMTFKKPGIVLILCNIHHEMSAFIVVLETPYFAITDIDGKFSIKDVPPGNYTLAVWNEDFKSQVIEVEVSDHGLASIDFLLKH